MLPSIYRKLIDEVAEDKPIAVEDLSDFVWDTLGSDGEQYQREVYEYLKSKNLIREKPTEQNPNRMQNWELWQAIEDLGRKTLSTEDFIFYLFQMISRKNLIKLYNDFKGSSTN